VLNFSFQEFDIFNPRFSLVFISQGQHFIGHVETVGFARRANPFGREQNVNAAFAFWGELAETRDVDGLKTLWPKGVQVARENVERAISTGQEVIGRTLKTNEAIGQIAKGQFERATAQAKDVATQVNDQVNKAANTAADQVNAQFNKAAKNK